MRHTLVIASRELREKSRVFVAVAGMSLLPFAALIPPNVRQEALTVAAALFAIVVGMGVAIMFGTSTIAGDLVEHRTSFYFSKPIAPAALWFGKAIAALLTSLASFAIIVAVSAPFTGKEFRQVWNQQAFGYVVLGIVVMFAISHTLGTMLRSRSPILGLDFLFLSATVAAFAYMLRPVILGAGVAMATRMLIICGAVIVLILFIAPVFQLAKGRTDIRRSHAALSRVLWISIAALILVAGAYVLWLVSVAPNDLVTITDLAQAPRGNAVFVSGRGHLRGDYNSTFLIDSTDGRFKRLESPTWWGLRFSRDGKVAAWMQPYTLFHPHSDFELYWRRLDDRDAKQIASGIRVQNVWDLTLSPDGSRVAMVADGLLSVHDLRTHRVLASFSNLDRVNNRSMFFVNDDLVRVIDWHKGEAKINFSEVNIPRKSFVRTGEHPTPGFYNTMRVSDDGTRMLISRSNVIADARSGATVATLPIEVSQAFSTAFLRDGTIVVAKTVNDNESRVSTFTADGKLLHEIAVPSRTIWFAAKLDNDKLLAVSRRTIYVIDAARGVLERTTQGARPAMPDWTDPRLTVYRADQQLAASASEGKLVLWNPATGELASFRTE